MNCELACRQAGYKPISRVDDAVVYIPLTIPLKVLYNTFMIDTVSITDLKQNTSSVVRKMQKGGKSVVIFQRSKPAAILVDPAYFTLLEQALEDLQDLRAIEDRRNEPRISFRDIAKKLKLNEN